MSRIEIQPAPAPRPPVPTETAPVSRETPPQRPQTGTPPTFLLVLLRCLGAWHV